MYRFLYITLNSISFRTVDASTIPKLSKYTEVKESKLFRNPQLKQNLLFFESSIHFLLRNNFKEFESLEELLKDLNREILLEMLFVAKFASY